MKEENGKQGKGPILEKHCSMLGHTLPFSYCMQARMDDCGAGRPCKKIMDCWWETFDVQSFLKDTLTEAEYEALLRKDPGNRRAASLFSALERALDNTDSNKNSEK